MNKNINKKQTGFSLLGLSILVLVLLGLVGFLFSFLSERGLLSLGQKEDSPEISWVEYENEEYEFKLKHPSDWKVSVSNKITPKINIYKPDQTGIEEALPLDHFDNLTHFSVYPQGIPTEGLKNKNRPVDFVFEESSLVNESREFLLENGDWFAFMIDFQPFPKNWNSSGFIFGSALVSDLTNACLRDGVLIDINDCEFLSSDQIIKAGTVSLDEQDILKEILQSFEFTTDVEEILINVDSPTANSEVESPFAIIGQARGNWFFEASFPARLEDEDGNVLTQIPVTAEGDWMTTDFVRFSAEMEFDVDEDTEAWLILEKDNPSGLPENADQIKIPLILKAS